MLHVGYGGTLRAQKGKLLRPMFSGKINTHSKYHHHHHHHHSLFRHLLVLRGVSWYVFEFLFWVVFVGCFSYFAGLHCFRLFLSIFSCIALCILPTSQQVVMSNIINVLTTYLRHFFGQGIDALTCLKWCSWKLDLHQISWSVTCCRHFSIHLMRAWSIKVVSLWSFILMTFAIIDESQMQSRKSEVWLHYLASLQIVNYWTLR